MPFGNRIPFRREHDTAIALVVQDAEVAEVLHHRGDAGLLHTEGGAMSTTRVAFGGDEFRDAFEAIFSAWG